MCLLYCLTACSTALQAVLAVSLCPVPAEFTKSLTGILMKVKDRIVRKCRMLFTSTEHLQHCYPGDLGCQPMRSASGVHWYLH